MALDRETWNQQLAQTNPDAYRFMITINPDIGDVLFAASQNSWSDPQTIDGWMHGTGYWTNTSESARQWDQLSVSDPREATKRLDNVVETVGNVAQRLGYQFQGTEYMEFANQAARENWDEQKIRTEVMKRWAVRNLGGDAATTYSQMPGEFGDIMTKVYTTAFDYGVPLTMYQAGENATNIILGKMSEESMTQGIRNWSKGYYSGNQAITDAINQGMTVRQFADPYVQLAAKELEKNPNTIDFSDPQWNDLINGYDSTGKRTPLSLSDATTKIRNDPVYGFDKTNNAQTQSASLTTGLGQMFGSIG